MLTFANPMLLILTEHSWLFYYESKMLPISMNNHTQKQSFLWKVSLNNFAALQNILLVYTLTLNWPFSDCYSLIPEAISYRIAFSIDNDNVSSC